MCHVLIIEDDQVAAWDIQATLQDAGATSFSFADTERSALAAALERRPGVITSDVMLASGFGPVAVRAIKKELGSIPVIYITATPEQCDDCDPMHVLSKPFFTGRLADAFRAVRPPLES